MSELQVNSISPSTAGTTTITIDAQVRGIPGTDPNHFVTLSQLGLNTDGPTTATGTPQTYVDSQDLFILTSAKEYASAGDAAALQLANAYSDVQNIIQTQTFNIGINSISDSVGVLTQLANSFIKSWSQMNPLVPDATKTRLLTKKEAIAATLPSTAIDPITGEIEVDANGQIIQVGIPTEELAALGIYVNETNQELHLSVILTTAGDGVDPLDGSLPAAAALLVGDDLELISKDFDISTSIPSTTSSPIDGITILDYNTNYYRRTSASTNTLFSVVPTGNYYRVVVSDHTPSNKEQVLVSWQEYRIPVSSSPLDIA